LEGSSKDGTFLQYCIFKLKKACTTNKKSLNANGVEASGCGGAGSWTRVQWKHPMAFYMLISWLDFRVGLWLRNEALTHLILSPVSKLAGFAHWPRHSSGLFRVGLIRDTLCIGSQAHSIMAF